MAGDYDLAFTDGSKLEDGKTGAGWTIRNQFYEGKGLGSIATVWDAEVIAIAETLKRSKGKRGRGRTKELREVADLIARRCKKTRQRCA